MQVIQIFTAGGYEVTVHPTAGPRDLTRQIVERGADYDLIVCTGGDGTLNEATSGLMQLEHRPPLGYIPGGTVNDVASSLGLSRDPVVAAQDIVHGKPFAIDIGAFGENRWFDYVAAFGLFTNVPYQTPQVDKRIWGRMAYFFNGVQALGEVHPVHARVSWDGKTVEADIIDGLVWQHDVGWRVQGDAGRRRVWDQHERRALRGRADPRHQKSRGFQRRGGEAAVDGLLRREHISSPRRPARSALNSTIPSRGRLDASSAGA